MQNVDKLSIFMHIFSRLSERSDFYEVPWNKPRINKDQVNLLKNRCQFRQRHIFSSKIRPKYSLSGIRKIFIFMKWVWLPPNPPTQSTKSVFTYVCVEVSVCIHERLLSFTSLNTYNYNCVVKIHLIFFICISVNIVI